MHLTCFVITLSAFPSYLSSIDVLAKALVVLPALSVTSYITVKPLDVESAFATSL